MARVEETASAIEEMDYSIKEVSRSVEDLSASTDETSSAVNEMDVSIGQVEQNANETSKLAELVSGDAALGVTSQKKTLAGISKIKESSLVAANVIGSLSMKTKSIYQGFLVHVTVAALMDWLSLSHRKALPKVWFPGDPLTFDAKGVPVVQGLETACFGVQGLKVPPVKELGGKICVGGFRDGPGGLWLAGRLGGSYQGYEVIVTLAMTLQAGQYTPDEAQKGFASANQAYLAGKVDEAVEGYEKLIAEGYGSSDVQYDLGTALLAQGKLGRAVLALERAKRQAPGDDDIAALASWQRGCELRFEAACANASDGGTRAAGPTADDEVLLRRGSKGPAR